MAEIIEVFVVLGTKATDATKSTERKCPEIPV
jgi:hypothetical protein